MLVPCDGTLAAEVPKPLNLPDNVKCFYGFVKQVFDDSTVDVVLETGQKVCVGCTGKH